MSYKYMGIIELVPKNTSSNNSHKTVYSNNKRHVKYMLDEITNDSKNNYKEGDRNIFVNSKLVGARK